MIGIGVISYFFPDDLTACLQSIIDNTKEPYMLAIYENSDDLSNANLVTSKFPTVAVLTGDRNEGCSKARVGLTNYFASYPEVTHMITLDQDMRVKPEWESDMLAVANKYPKTGVVGWPQFTRHTPNADGVVIEVGAGATMYDMQMLKETGGFEPGFFMYRFDSWMCFLARHHGWSTRVVMKYWKHSKHGYNACASGVEHFHPNRAIRAFSTWPIEQIKSQILFDRLLIKYKMTSIGNGFPFPSNWRVKASPGKLTISHAGMQYELTDTELIKQLGFKV